MRAAPAIVLLPGLDGTGILFEPLLEALPKDISPTVIAYPSDRVMSLPEHADWVASRLPGGKIVLLAESFSGLVALALLVEAPSRFQRVIFVGSFAEPPKPFLSRFAPMLPAPGARMRTIPAFLLRQYCLGNEATVEQLNLVRCALSSVSPGVLSNRFSLVSQRHSFGAGRFKVPAHYIQAAHDRLVPERCIPWFQRRFESLELVRIDGPHFLLETRPAECARIIAQVVHATDHAPQAGPWADDASRVTGHSLN